MSKLAKLSSKLSKSASYRAIDGTLDEECSTDLLVSAKAALQADMKLARCPVHNCSGLERLRCRSKLFARPLVSIECTRASSLLSVKALLTSSIALCSVRTRAADAEAIKIILRTLFLGARKMEMHPRSMYTCVDH